MDPQAIGELFDDAAQGAQVADEGRDAVGLVEADVADAADRGRAVRERGQTDEGRRQLAGSGQIEVDAVDGGATADGEHAAAPTDASAEQRQQIRKQRSGLRRVRRPARHRDLAPCDECRSQERGGVREVGFDRQILGPRRAAFDEPLARGGALDVDAATAQRLDRHVDVREARKVLALVNEVQADIEARGSEEQARDELARQRGVDLDAAAADVPTAANRERQRPAAFIVDVDAQITQSVNHRAHGAMQSSLMSGEDDVALCQTGEGSDEAHDGACLPAVDRRAALQSGGCHEQIRAERTRGIRLFDPHAQCAQRIDHACGIIGVQRREKASWTVGDRREDELAIGKRFRPRHAQQTRHRTLCDRREVAPRAGRGRGRGIVLSAHRFLPY